jgi:hypothetical protein
MWIKVMKLDLQSWKRRCFRVIFNDGCSDMSDVPRFRINFDFCQKIKVSGIMAGKTDTMVELHNSWTWTWTEPTDGMLYYFDWINTPILVLYYSLLQQRTTQTIKL